MPRILFPLENAPLTRRQHFDSLYPDQPKFRIAQIEKAIFDPKVTGWQDITTLPADMRKTLTDSIPWMSSTPMKTLSSKFGDTHKAVLKAHDGVLFETVLMRNKRDQWSICVSSQIGCAMGCVFCATGAMGFTRNLTSDEIADQYRFWKAFLLDKPDLPQRISNVVFMGMGEPLVNIPGITGAIHTWLDQTDIGPTKITVSTVGVLPALEKLLTDPDWPPVRIAISLHSPDQARRKEIVPTTVPDFHKKLADWTHRYEKTLGNRNHHITFEYTLIAGVNDTEEEAMNLVRFVKTTAAVKVNVIPLNTVGGKPFSASTRKNIESFKKVLLNHGIDVTERKTMGDDIAAACGQLALVVKDESGKIIG